MALVSPDNVFGVNHTIIGMNDILTAGHCVSKKNEMKQPKTLKIVFGMNDLLNPNGECQYQLRLRRHMMFCAGVETQ